MMLRKLFSCLFHFSVSFDLLTSGAAALMTYAATGTHDDSGRVSLFIFFCTLALYQFQRATKALAGNVIATKHFLVAGISLVIIFFFFGTFFFDSLPLVAVLLVIAALYSWIFRLRIIRIGSRLFFLKTLLLCGSWITVTAILPCFLLHKDPSVQVMLSYLFLLVLACLCYDERDVEKDRQAEVVTVATLLPEKSMRTVKVSIAALSILTSVVMIFNGGEIFFNAASLVVCSVFMIAIHKHDPVFSMLAADADLLLIMHPVIFMMMSSL